MRKIIRFSLFAALEESFKKRYFQEFLEEKNKIHQKTIGALSLKISAIMNIFIINFTRKWTASKNP